MRIRSHNTAKSVFKSLLKDLDLLTQWNSYPIRIKMVQSLEQFAEAESLLTAAKRWSGAVENSLPAGS